MSLDAVQYDEIAQRLAHALKITRLVVERAENQGGQKVYREIPADALLGRLMQLGWRVSLVPLEGGEPQQIGEPDPAQRNLRLMDSSTVADDESDGA